jgi:hypothetical protein
VGARTEQGALVRADSRGCSGFAGPRALGQNTHELVTRWLGLPLREKSGRRLITTDGEIHSAAPTESTGLAEEGVP